MAHTQKFKQVMAVLERRIRRGDYLLRPIPSERRIAEETGVSHMTARKAVRGLLDRNVLVRQPNGALAVSPDFHADPAGGGASPQVILLYPAYSSAFLTALRQVVADAADAHGLRVRPVQYVHWDDPVVVTAVGHAGGVIVIPSSPGVPPHLLATLTASRVVVLDGDLHYRDLPSIRLFPEPHVNQVFDHLLRLGHTRIDCVSSHVHNAQTDARVRLWREWSARHGTAGELWERPAPSFSDPTPYAYGEMRQLLLRGAPRATAFVGTTFPAAVGAMRACRDHGLVVGRDVSVCAMNVEWPAQFMTPSVTGLDMPDVAKVLGDCFEWFASDRPWEGTKRLQPAHARLFEGESTGRIGPPGG